MNQLVEGKRLESVMLGSGKVYATVDDGVVGIKITEERDILSVKVLFDDDSVLFAPVATCFALTTPAS